MTSGYKVPPTDIWAPGPRFLVPRPAVPGSAAGLRPHAAGSAVPAAGRPQHRHYVRRHRRQPAGAAGGTQPAARLIWLPGLLRPQPACAHPARAALRHQPRAEYDVPGRRVADGCCWQRYRLAVAQRPASAISRALACSPSSCLCSIWWFPSRSICAGRSTCRVRCGGPQCRTCRRPSGWRQRAGQPEAAP